MDPAHVLVAFASRAGGTRDIARVIGVQLERAGALVDLESTDQASDPAAYDAVVLGSAVYFGSWEPSALRYVDLYRGSLHGRPLWLFSSGPLDQARAQAPSDPPRGIEELAHELGAREHRVFGGVLAPSTTGIVGGYLAEKGLAGDFRDMEAVRVWARGIATRVVRPAPATS